MTDDRPIGVTPGSSIAANGLIAALLDWRDAPDEKQTQERRSRFADMVEEAVADHGAGHLVTSLATIAGAMANQLATAKGLSEQDLLRTIADLYAGE